MQEKPSISYFFDPVSCTLSYVVSMGPGSEAVIIDPVWDYHGAGGRLGAKCADAIVRYCQTQDLKVIWIVETHAHADHITAAQYLKERLGGRVGAGRGILRVQRTFAAIFNLNDIAPDGADFDGLFEDGERIPWNGQYLEVVATPGHTPDGVSYRVDDAVFIGDTLFAPDFGSARADFPGGDAAELYDSVQRLLELPAKTRLFLCHDYQPGGRELQWCHTVEEQRLHNIHIGEGTTKEDFIAMREDRDSDLPVPALLIPAIQVNIRAGRLPKPEENGISYLKIPVNGLDSR